MSRASAAARSASRTVRTVVHVAERADLPDADEDGVIWLDSRTDYRFDVPVDLGGEVLGVRPGAFVAFSAESNVFLRLGWSDSDPSLIGALLDELL